MLIFPLLCFDMFGVQVMRACDLTSDRQDDVVVTSPIGTQVRPSQGRVFLVDTKSWTVISTLEGTKAEKNFGSTASLAKTATKCYLAVGSAQSSDGASRVHVYDLSPVQELWASVVGTCSTSKDWGPNMCCIADSGTPEVLYVQSERLSDGNIETLVLNRQSSKSTARIGLLGTDDSWKSGVNMMGLTDAQKGKSVVYVSMLRGYKSPLAWNATRPPTRIYRGEVGVNGVSVNELAVSLDYVDGVALLPNMGWADPTKEALMTRRVHDGEGGVFAYGLDGLGASPVYAANVSRDFGASMCYLGDLDNDGVPELAIGCPERFGGTVQIVGSHKRELLATVDSRVLPGPEGSMGRLTLSGFGSSLASIPDQDGDGKDDLLVGAFSIGSCWTEPSALSIVGSSTWKILRVLFEADVLLSAPSSEPK